MVNTCPAPKFIPPSQSLQPPTSTPQLQRNQQVPPVVGHGAGPAGRGAGGAVRWAGLLRAALGRLPPVQVARVARGQGGACASFVSWRAWVFVLMLNGTWVHERTSRLGDQPPNPKPNPTTHHTQDFVSTTSKSTALADAFAAMNEPYLTSDTLLADPAARGDGTVVISFSHFLPRQELCPEKRFLIEPNLTKVRLSGVCMLCVALHPSLSGLVRTYILLTPSNPQINQQVIGSAPLGRQVARLRPDLHLNGHTHIPIDITLDDGIRYLQWPLGSVSEQSRQCAEMARQGPILVYEDTPGARGLAEVGTEGRKEG